MWVFGTTLDADLAEAEKSKTKKPKSEKQINLARQQVMARWLGTTMSNFRPPPASAIKSK